MNPEDILLSEIRFRGESNSEPEAGDRMGRGSLCLTTTQSQFRKMERVLKMAGGDGNATMWMHFTSLSGTLKNG